MKKIFTLGILLLFFLPFVNALGITGPRFLDPIQFEPNYEQELTYIVTGYNWDVRIYAEGDLKQYVTFTEPIKSQDSTTITANIKLPERIAKPGLNSLFMVFNDVPPEGGFISASITIRKAIWFEVLYPNKKVKVTLNTPNVNINETVNMLLIVRSLTEQNISKVNAVIDVFDSNNNSIKTLETVSKVLPSGESISFKKALSTKGYLPGNYDVRATVFWDDDETETSSTFKIGTLSVNVKSYTKEFVKDAVNKFDVTIESKWNARITYLHSELYIGDEKVGSTPTETLQAWATMTLQGYFDATGYEFGEHPARLITKFDGQSAIEEFTAIIKEADLESESSEEKPRWGTGGITIKLSTTNILIIIIALLVVGNLIYFFFQKKKKVKERRDKPQKSKKIAKNKEI